MNGFADYFTGAIVRAQETWPCCVTWGAGFQGHRAGYPVRNLSGAIRCVNPVRNVCFRRSTPYQQKVIAVSRDI